MKSVYIFFIFVFFLIFILNYIWLKLDSMPKKLNKPYYGVNEVEPTLHKIHKLRTDILYEMIFLEPNKWNDWPEKKLYDDKNGSWKIYPFFAFGIWVKSNCESCPTISNFLKQIPNLKLATLSKLGPNTKLVPHRGWGSHSNHVIRCHYGVNVPQNCYVVVDDIKKNHNNDEWIIFDDSKNHWAGNDSDSDRIVLILDIERPPNIEIGTSDVTDSKELLEIVEYFRKNNIIDETNQTDIDK